MDTEYLKFRAWHREKGVMLQVSEIDLQKKRIKGHAGDEIISARFDEIILMPMVQGYTDSKGRELYEGDIIEAHERGGNYYYVIEADGTMHNAERQASGYEMWEVVGEYYTEKTGNIYERQVTHDDV